MKFHHIGKTSPLIKCITGQMGQTAGGLNDQKETKTIIIDESQER